MSWHNAARRLGIWKFGSQGDLPQPWRPHLAQREFLPLGGSHSPSDEDEVQLSVLCLKCSRIRKWLRVHFVDLEEWTRRHGGEEVSQSLKYHKTTAALEESFKSGCHLCTLIWEELLGPSGYGIPITNRKVRLETIRQSKRVSITIRLPYNGPLEEVIVHGDVHRAVGTLVPTLVGSGSIEEVDSGLVEEVGSGLIIGSESTEEDGPSGLLLTKRANIPTALGAKFPVCTNTTSCREVMLKWVTTCAKKHTSCRVSVASYLPSRLLHILDSDDLMVRLVERANIPHPQSPRYAALGYYRYGEADIMLTQASYQQLVNGISVSYLPRTVRDAVSVASQLKLEWIWVDSLCMIQDTLADWDREAASMGDVYQGCFVCLAAREGARSNDGLFARRDPLPHTACFLFDTAAGDAVAVCSPYGIKEDATQRALKPRGWMIQEQISPPRILKFGSYLSWECREALVDEFSPESPPGYPSFRV